MQTQPTDGKLDGDAILAKSKAITRPFWMCDDCEDLAQEAAVSAIRAIGKAESNATYVDRMMVGSVNHRLREKRREIKRSGPFPGDVIFDDSEASHPDNFAEVGERSGILKSCLESLAMEERKLIEQVFFKGATLWDVSRETGAPHTSLRRTYHSALNKLRRLLASAGIEKLEDIL